MGTTSSFFGGSGGGGDPTGKFQAAATIAEGDLVALNNNGTVQPVTSTSVANNYAKSDNGTKLEATSTPTFGMTGYSANYNQTHNYYIFISRIDGGNLYCNLRTGTYNSGTGEYSLSLRAQVSAYANWMSQKRSPSEGYIWGYRGSNGYIYSRGIRWNGSNYVFTSETYHNTSSTSSADVYCEANGDGSSSFAIAALLNGNTPAVGHGSWDGSSSQPTSTDQLTNYNSDTLAGYGTNWTGNTLSGAHVKNNVHVLGAKQSNAKLFACRVESSGTTYGAVANTGFAMAQYPSRIIYDNDVGVGVYQFVSGSTPKYVAFSVNIDTLAITVHGALELPSGFTGYGSSIGWSPTAKTWVAVDHLGGEIFAFTLNSTGAIVTSSTGQFAPGHTGSPSVNLQYQMMFPTYGSGGAMNIVFNGDAAISGSGAGSYMDTTNNLYVSQFDVPYIDTNVDLQFGEAKEAISNGAAGSVAILNRNKNIVDSTFQKGQKLFANPSGTALATSGTYRVGHALDADDILVLGDPS